MGKEGELCRHVLLLQGSRRVKVREVHLVPLPPSCAWVEKSERDSLQLKMEQSLCALVLLGCFLASCALVTTGNSKKQCPEDYRYRVEICIMEAQVAPQAGGGLPLITERNKLDELCERGLLHKTIDCLQELYDRCSSNATRKHELNMLFDLNDWKQGKDLLCEDLNLFRKHFHCVSKYAARISGCIFVKTKLFKKAVTDAGIVLYKNLHDITCNFAENIVNCLERPLSYGCSLKVVDTMVRALHRFLPPACAPIPAVSSEVERKSSHSVLDFETVMLEGGEDII